MARGPRDLCAALERAFCEGVAKAVERPLFLRGPKARVDPTGLYHLRARQYDTATGRFLQVDPAVGSSRQPYVAAYPYVADRSSVMTDRTGENFVPADAGPRMSFLSTSPARSRRTAPSRLADRTRSTERSRARRRGGDLRARHERTRSDTETAANPERAF